MGYLSLVCAAVGVAAVAIAGAGKYLAVGLGLFAIGAGMVGYRRAGGRPSTRLAGAGGIALGLVALALGGTKIGLTLMALERLRRLFGP